MKLFKHILLSVAALLILGSPFFYQDNALAQEVIDNSIYADLLKKYVKNGVVDYRGFKQEEVKLDKYLTILAQVKPDQLPRDEQFAFYINLYNAWTVKLILTEYPGVESIKDLGSILKSPWKKKIARLKGEVITLDDIEHSILRPRFKDPRVHFAVNCASKGCPPLRSEPYLGSTLDQQLNNSTATFLNDPLQNYLKEGELYVSKIFKLFNDDFNNGVYNFFLKYARSDLKKELHKLGGNIKIQYLDYDWSLNGS